jgi:hypothetical protein
MIRQIHLGSVVELGVGVDGKIRVKASGRRMISSERGGGTVSISEGGYSPRFEPKIITSHYL